MAKGDIGYLERKTRDIPKADITVIVLIVVAFGVLVLPGTAFSEYIITTEHGKVSAQTYWILRDRLYLKDKGNLTSVPLREMKSIEGGASSDLERDLHKEALSRFSVQLKDLMDTEILLLKIDSKNTELLGHIRELKASGRRSSEFKKVKKRAGKQLDFVEKEVMILKQSWEDITLPDKSLVILRDIKVLRLSSLVLHIRDSKRFIKSGDPTDMDYSIEHLRQSSIFEERFKRLLSSNSVLAGK